MTEERFDRIEVSLHKLTFLHEETRDHLKLLAEGLATTNERMDRGFARIDERLDRVETRLDRVEVRLDRMEVRLDSVEITLRGVVDNHEKRIAAVERRSGGR